MNSTYNQSTLSNGLRLITIPMPGVQSLTAILLVGVGSRYETGKTRGISHFLEHLPFKGTQKYPDSLKLSSVLDSVGAEFNAFTGKECTGFYVKTAAKHLDLALDILSQLVFHPLLDEKEIEKEKGVIVEEINMYEDQPMIKVMWDFESLIYGNTALGWETIGTKETVSSFKRSNFASYLDHWYQPKNMVVGVAGATPQTQNSKLKTQSLIKKYFNTKKTEEKSNKSKKLTFRQSQPAVSLRSKKTEQAHLCLGVRAFKRTHPDRYALAVLATLLGGNMSSRLFMEVREKRGLAYYVKTVSQDYVDNGYLMTRAGADIKKAGEAIKVIWEEYNKAKSLRLKAKSELTKAKEYIKGKMILSLEDSEEVASLYAEDWLMESKIHTPEEIIKEIDKVTTEDLVRVSRHIFQPKNLNLSIIGPYNNKNREDFEKILE